MLNALYRRSFSSKVLHVGQMCMRGFKFSYQADADEIHYFGGSDKIADSQSLFLSEHQRLLQGWQQNKCKGGLEVSQIRSLFQVNNHSLLVSPHYGNKWGFCNPLFSL